MVRAHHLLKSILLCVVLLWSLPAAATTSVEPSHVAILGLLAGVQPPAWVERAGVRAAARPGWALYDGDRLETGEGGRISLALAQYGRLLLGAHTHLRIEAPQALLHLQLLAGVLRYLAPPQGAEAALHFDGGEARIGGSIWARLDPAGLHLGPVENSVILRVREEPEVELHRGSALLLPLQGQGPRRVSPLDEAQTRAELRHTDTRPEAPVLRGTGEWAVAGHEVATLADVQAESCRLHELGFHTNVRAIASGGRSSYRLELHGLANARDAARLRDQLRRLGVQHGRIVMSEALGRSAGSLVEACPQRKLPLEITAMPAYRAASLRN